MAYFTIGGKTIFQDKQNPELRSLINAIHKAEEVEDFELNHSPHASDARMTDAEFARHVRVKYRQRNEAMRNKEQP